MSVSNYIPDKKYKIGKLKDHIFLFEKNRVGSMSIDKGNAFVSNIDGKYICLNGYNVSLSEESSINERYKFSKTVQISTLGYLHLKDLNEYYYIVVENREGTLFVVNPDFAAEVEYTYTIDSTSNHTDFTFKCLSNYPTLQYLSTLQATDPKKCSYWYGGAKKLQMIDKNKASLDTASKSVNTYGDVFSDIQFNPNSLTFTEQYANGIVTDTLQFNITLDKYKASWHYNLLEFLDNRYSAIITPNDGDELIYTGFNEFGLEPSYSIETSGEINELDNITITLVERSTNGMSASSSMDSISDDSTSFIPISSYTVGFISSMSWECCGDGVAKFLLQQEVNSKGIPTGNYMALEGYENRFRSLNIIGTFSDVITFQNPQCSAGGCVITTNMPYNLVFSEAKCNTYDISSTCDWEIRRLPSFITASKTSGSANEETTIDICNTQKAPTSVLEGSFEIVSGSLVRVENVRVIPSEYWISPLVKYINAAKQDVSFGIKNLNGITVTNDAGLSYNLKGGVLIVTVPVCPSFKNEKKYELTVKENGTNETATLYIIQSPAVEKWYMENENEYMCNGGNSYHILHRYTGVTDTRLVSTGEQIMGELIKENDNRCSNRTTRWSNLGHFTCDGKNKYSILEEEESYDGGTTWTKTGATRLGNLVEENSSYCDQEVTYKWVITDNTICENTL